MKTKITLIFVSTLLLLKINSVYGEDILTWKECVRKARENHPDLAASAEKVKQAKADKDIDVSAILPEITGAASGRRGKTGSGKTNSTFAYSATGQQLVFDGYKTASEVSNSVKAIEAAEYDYKVVSSNIRLDLRNAFTGLLKTQELVSLTEDIAKRRKQNLEMVKLRYEAGREHKGSLLTAEADLARAEFEAGQAKRSIPLVRRELSKGLGLTKMKPMKAEGEFSIDGNYDVMPDFEYLADATPFLKELIAKKEAARYNLQSAESDFFPKAYLNTSAGKTGKSIFPRKKEWSAGMSFSYPIFDGLTRIAGVSKARSQLNQARAEERSGRDGVLVTLETTWKDLQDAIEGVSVDKKYLEAAEERAKISEAQYEKGLISFDDWVIIEANLVDAKKSYLDAEANMLSAEASWIQAIGGTLEYDPE